MNFQVLVDDALISCAPDCGVFSAGKKWVLSLINDFEDGAWRYTAFQDVIWDSVALTALSHRERLSLVGRSHTELRTAARNLRLTDKPDDVGEGSELAEVLLYAVMQHHFGALPVVPKIFYKQNRQDFAKGADSVHIVLDEAGGFTLWLGEAKFYTSIEDSRLNSVVQSVLNTLSSDKIRKETSIIANLADLDLLEIPDATRGEIRAALDQDLSIDELKPRLHVPILLLHQCAETATTTIMTAGYRDSLRAHHKERATAYFRKQVAGAEGVHMYKSVAFHIILVPVPSKSEVVRRFIEKATTFQER